MNNKVALKESLDLRNLFCIEPSLRADNTHGIFCTQAIRNPAITFHLWPGIL